jgi:hypothetical protein
VNNKLEQLVIKYLNKFYGNLDKHILEEYPGSVYFAKDNIIYFEQDIAYKSLYVDRASIWADLEDTFDLGEFDIKCIVYKWAKQTYNIQGCAPRNFFRQILDKSEGKIKVYM